MTKLFVSQFARATSMAHAVGFVDREPLLCSSWVQRGQSECFVQF